MRAPLCRTPGAWETCSVWEQEPEQEPAGGITESPQESCGPCTSQQLCLSHSLHQLLGWAGFTPLPGTSPYQGQLQDGQWRGCHAWPAVCGQTSLSPVLLPPSSTMAGVLKGREHPAARSPVECEGMAVEWGSHPRPLTHAPTVICTVTCVFTRSSRLMSCSA